MEHGSLLTNMLHSAGLPASFPDGLVMATLVAGILTLLALVGGRRLSVEHPGGLQQLLEVAIGGFTSLLEDTIPHHGRNYLRLIGTFGLFILFSNLLGMVPTMTSPSTTYSVTIALALTSFIYYNAVGIKAVGIVHYVKHLMGPVLGLAFLIMPIEIIGHLARVLSLSMRLFGNISGEHAASAVFYGFAGGFGAPLPMMALGLFGSFLQAFIFVLLSMIYIALVTEH